MAGRQRAEQLGWPSVVYRCRPGPGVRMIQMDDPISSDFIRAFLNARSVKVHGLELLSRLDTIDLLRYAHRQDVQLRGIDAFILTGSGTQPDMEHDYVFSITGLEDVVARLAHLPDSYHFEFWDLIDQPSAPDQEG